MFCSIPHLKRDRHANYNIFVVQEETRSLTGKKYSERIYLSLFAQYRSLVHWVRVIIQYPFSHLRLYLSHDLSQLGIYRIHQNLRTFPGIDNQREQLEHKSIIP